MTARDAEIAELYRRRRMLEREGHLIAARLAEIAGDTLRAEFHHLAAQEPVDFKAHRAAFLRMQAADYLASGTHWDTTTDPAERATIERLAAELTLVRAEASAVVRGAQATAQIIGGES